MKVADFFCGGGGFSEGFRQAGFDVCFGVDKWLPAVNTFKANKPSAKVYQDDVIRISELPDKEFEEMVPDTEVIIGSPPCVSFSNSNKSGNGDKTLGLKLLRAYLRIIARKKYKKNSILKYWVLENVPNIQSYIKDEYTANDLGLEGDFVLKVKNENSKVYNAKYFGAPTNRQRYLCGDFPKVIETNNEKNIKSLKVVLESLGDPVDKQDRIICDCNYPQLKMKLQDITDFQYEHVLQEFEWKTAKRLKLDRGYMGKMSFPENLDKPARTVMATMSSSSRESMILERKCGGYRIPSIREVANMMSFPNDYRFYGNSEGTKYALVGNAVPPKLSYAIAKAILFEEGKDIPKSYIRIRHNEDMPFINLNNTILPEKKERHKNKKAKFKYHIPYLIYSAYRVELTNHHSDFDEMMIRWDVEIHYSQGKSRAACFTPIVTNEFLTLEETEIINAYIEEICGKICSFDDFQKRYCMTQEERNDLIGPYELLEFVRKTIDQFLIEEERGKIIQIKDNPENIPKATAVGYYMLQEVIKRMED